MNEPSPYSRPRQHWIDKVIQEAQDAGAFDGLPGMGKPIPGMGEPDDENWWLRSFLRREGVSIVPPTLEIRREVEKALQEIDRLGAEELVRARVRELNDRIRGASGATVHGPASNTNLLDEEEVVRRWRSRHASR